MEILFQAISAGLVAVGVLAFVTSVVTQVTKSWGIFDRIPTQLQVYLISLILTLMAAVVYMQYNGIPFVWYYIAGAVVLSFLVSFVTTNGWDQLMTLWNRFYRGSKENMDIDNTQKEEEER